MILVVDVGNTNITYGVFDGDELVSTFRMMSKTPRTSDEYGIMIREMLKKNDIDRQEIEGICVASVVPNIMHSLLSGLSKYVNESILTVGAGTKTGIKIITEAPKEIGPDRIVDAVGAYVKYGGPILVLDFGTATTYDYITEKGEFAAGITAPGLRISAKALWEDTAKLPEIEIKKPANILGKDTITSMQSGLVFGQIGQTEYIINKVKEEVGLSNIKTVVTGGLGRIIANETSAIDVYDPNLTLKGIYLVYKKQNRKV